jgi:hypothetical protein
MTPDLMEQGSERRAAYLAKLEAKGTIGESGGQAASYGRVVTPDVVDTGNGDSGAPTSGTARMDIDHSTWTDAGLQSDPSSPGWHSRSGASPQGRFRRLQTRVP